MKSKVEELDAINLDLRRSVATLEEKVAKEESDKLVRLPSLGIYKNYVISHLFLIVSPSLLYTSLCLV